MSMSYAFASKYQCLLGIAIDGLMKLIVQHNFGRLQCGRCEYVTILHKINCVVAPKATETLLSNAHLRVILRGTSGEGAHWLLLLLQLLSICCHLILQRSIACLAIEHAGN